MLFPRAYQYFLGRNTDANSCFGLLPYNAVHAQPQIPPPPNPWLNYQLSPSLLSEWDVTERGRVAYRAHFGASAIQQISAKSPELLRSTLRASHPPNLPTPPAFLYTCAARLRSFRFDLKPFQGLNNSSQLS